MIIKPYSRVALVGVSALMSEDLGNNLFEIQGTGDGEYEIGVDGEVANAIVSTGVYDINEFSRAMQQAANFTGAPDDDLLKGLDHKFTVTNNTLTIDTASSPYVAGNADFTKWRVLFGEPDVGTNVNTLDNDGAGTASLILDDVIARVHSESSWTLTTQEGYDIHINARRTESSAVTYGFNNLSNIYSKTLNGVTTSIVDSTAATITPADGDTVFIETYGGNVRYFITDSTGTGKGTGFGSLPLVAGEYIYKNVISKAANNEILHWTLLLEQGALISNCGYSTISNFATPYSIDPLLKDSNVSAVIQFVDKAGDDNPTLATYSGFGGIFSVIEYFGNPASLRAPEPMLGLANQGAVLITLDGVGKLASFDGSQESKSAANIVYVLNSAGAFGQYIQVDVASLIYLDLQNSAELNVNQLRARFLSGAGYQTGERVLKFLGTPSLTFIIDEPK